MVKKRRYLLLLLICVLGIGAWLFYRHQAGEFKWLIKPQYRTALNFHKGVAWVQEELGGPYNLINKQGDVMNTLHVRYIDPFIDQETGFLAFQNMGGGAGYINLSGDIVISPDYTNTVHFIDGVACVQKGDFYGVIDKHGEIVLPFIYQYVSFVDSGMFAVQKDDKWGFVNAKGEMLIDFTFELVRGRPFSGVYAVALEKKWGLIDNTGQWIMPTSYDSIYVGPNYPTEREPSLIAVEKDGKVGYVDAKGNMVIDFQYKVLEREGVKILGNFSEGLAAVVLPSKDANGEDKLGVIDRTGKVLFELPGYSARDYNEGYMPVYHRAKKRYGLVDRKGKMRFLPSGVEVPFPFGFSSDGVLQVVEKDSDGQRRHGYLEIHK